VCVPSTGISDGSYKGPVQCIKNGHVDTLLPHRDFFNKNSKNYKNVWAVRCEVEKFTRCIKDPTTPKSKSDICKATKTAKVIRVCAVKPSNVPSNAKDANAWMKDPAEAAKQLSLFPQAEKDGSPVKNRHHAVSGGSLITNDKKGMTPAYCHDIPEKMIRANKWGASSGGDLVEPGAWCQQVISMY